MKIKNGCKISISGRNKRRILLGVVILSIVAMLTPVSLAATAGMSIEKIIEKDLAAGVNENTNIGGKELTVGSNNANNVETKIAGDSSSNTQSGSSNDVTNNNIINPALDSNNNNNLGSNQPNPDISNSVNQVNPIGGTETIPDSRYGNFKIPESLEVGDVFIWDAGYRYDYGIWQFIPANLSGHCAIFTGNRYFYEDKDGIKHYSEVKDDIYKYYAGNFVEATRQVQFNTINGSNFEGFHYFAVGRMNTTPEVKEAAAKWAISRIGDGEQQFWNPTYGPSKSFTPTAPSPNYKNKLDININKLWYCSELVWAAYYNVTNATNNIDNNGGKTLGTGSPSSPKPTQIDIDPNGWSPQVLFLMLWDKVSNSKLLFDSLKQVIYEAIVAVAVTPLEIYNGVEIVYDTRWPNGGNGTTTEVSLSVDSDSNSNSNALIYHAYSDSKDTALNYLNSGSASNTLSYSDSKDNAVNSLSSGSSSKTLSYSISNISNSNTNTLIGKLLKILRGHGGY